MKTTNKIYTIAFLVLQSASVFSQNVISNKVVITGVRFSYPLVEKWIKDYKVENPNSNILIESRSTTDPAKYDLLIEAYEPEAAVKETREYAYIARYALLLVANSKSPFAKTYGDKGLTRELIKLVYFNDIYADKKDLKKIKAEHTIYTRLQKAGAPITFSKYFGYEQANIKGNTISGADEHLIKAVLKDSLGISYNVPGLLYNNQTRKLHDGLTIIPVDIDDDGRVSNDEKFYENLDGVLEKVQAGELKNIPVENIHLSIAKANQNVEALKFLRWVIDHGQESLNAFGFLKPDHEQLQNEKEKFEALAFNRRK